MFVSVAFLYKSFQPAFFTLYACFFFFLFYLLVLFFYLHLYMCHYFPMYVKFKSWIQKIYHCWRSPCPDICTILIMRAFSACSHVCMLYIQYIICFVGFVCSDIRNRLLSCSAILWDCCAFAAVHFNRY